MKDNSKIKNLEFSNQLDKDKSVGKNYDNWGLRPM